jgi:hypothetical protein
MIPKLPIKLCLALLLPLPAFATNYYVTPGGGGNHSGTSSYNPWSVNDFNNSHSPTGGDTVTFTGTFTSTITPGSNGTSNASRLTLNLRAATLTSAYTRLQLNTRSYLTVLGGSLGSAYDAVCINFNPNTGGTSHDITIDGFSYTGAANGVALFLSLNHAYNLTVSNCSAENVGDFVAGDSTQNHDLLITGCYAGGSTDVTGQDDLIHIGDAANVTIEKCKLIGRAPANPTGRHNDVIQNYTKGGSYPGNPTNWVIRYNWIELQQRSGSGDCSWIMFQSMNGSPALKVYGNVFIGTGTIGDNGILVSRNAGGTYYLYNNTFIRHGNPANAVRFLAPGNLYARNNLAEGDSAVTNFITCTMGYGNGWDYNYFYRTTASAAYAGSHGSVSVDPLFANYYGNVFSLLSNSPVRGKGDTSIGGEYNQGIAPGASWPNPRLTARSPWSIGAFAY